MLELVKYTLNVFKIFMVFRCSSPAPRLQSHAEDAVDAEDAKGCSVLLTMKLPEVFCTHFILLRRIKSLIRHSAT